MSQQIAPYDYGELDPDTAAFLQASAQRIHALERRTVESTAAIGDELLAAKERLPHGGFMGWIQNVLGYEYSTARRMMNTALLYRKFSNVGKFATSVVGELAEPNTPEDVIRATIAGEIPGTVQAVKEAKRQALGGDASNGSNGSNGSNRVSKPAPSAALLLYNLLNSDDLDDLDTDDGKEDLICYLSDFTARGDAADVRRAAHAFAQIIGECAEIAATRQPTNIA